MENVQYAARGALDGLRASADRLARRDALLLRLELARRGGGRRRGGSVSSAAGLTALLDRRSPATL